MTPRFLDLRFVICKQPSWLEIGANLTATNGDWFAIEKKLNPTRNDDATNQMEKFRNKVDSESVGK